LLGQLRLDQTGHGVPAVGSAICCRLPPPILRVVESTGLSDPLPIVLTFLRSELRDQVRVDSIITIADADSFSLDFFASEAARNQLRYADTILLNMRSGEE
jgi:hypothetical protein